MPAARVNVVTKFEEAELVNLDKCWTLEAAIRRMSWTMWACSKFRKRDCGAELGWVTFRGKAENHLIRVQQEAVRVKLAAGKLISLRAEVVSVEGMFQQVELVVTAGRLGDKLLVGYDKAKLPILEADCKLAVLFMSQAHGVDHGGVDRTLQRSRNHVWIVHGRRLSKMVVNNCYTCRVANKTAQTQSMGAVHDNRVCPTAVFDWTAVDLFGPLAIRDTVKRRVTSKCWGVVFCCTTSSAVHIEVSESYSADSLLQCFKRFINMRGSPRNITSDPGSQVIAAAEVMKSWDYAKIAEWAGRRCITWHKIPVNSQHFNGCAEAMVKVVKKQLGILMHGRIFTKGEMDTFSDVMQIINSRPLVGRAGSDPGESNPITPNHLLMGRATLEVPVMQFEEGSSLTRRVAFIESIKREFWSKWVTQVFPRLLPSYRWHKEQRNVAVGDVVLLTKESELSNSYRLAVVKEVTVDADGRVRKVLAGYKNVDGGVEYKRAGYKEYTTERAIHGIVVVVPVEQQLEAADLGPRPLGNMH